MAEIDYDALAKKFGAIDQPQPEQAVDYDALAAQYGATQPEQKPMSWGEVAGQAVVNAPASVGGLVKGVYEAVTSPVQTARGLVDVAAGGLQNILPETLVQMVNQIDPNVKSAEEARAKADMLGQFYANRYGSEEGFKQALATDPASVMADAATVLTGGGTAVTKLSTAPKLGALAPVGRALSTTGMAIDPLRLAAKGTIAAGKGAVNLAQKGLGMTTGAGSEALKQAYEAGKTGGQTAESFQSNLRGNAPMTDVLDTAKADLTAIKAAKSAEYSADMNAIKTDKAVLNFNNIDNALNNAQSQVSYKGLIKNQTGAEILDKIRKEVEVWKNSNPAEYHTPEGLDALKQNIGGIVDSIPINEKTAIMVGNNIYNSIKSEIVKQAPTYAKTMKAYENASEKIREIEKALSLGRNASADTAMRKLQSLMRNNVNTNYGQRLKLAQELEQQGGGQLMPALAGQALSSWTPRGLQSASTLPTAYLGYGAGGVPLAVAGLAAGIPRVAGEAMYYAGKTGGAVTAGGQRLSDLAARLNVSPTVATNILYQADQANQ